MKIKRKFVAAVAALVSMCTVASAGTWQPLNHQPNNFAPGINLLLTDGTVLVQDSYTDNWWKLIPDINGSYVNGSWTKVANTPGGYAPTYFASAVLANGNVVVIGGEYQAGNAVWQTTGYIYNPVANNWTFLPAPAGWAKMGDAQCTVLPNGNFLLANPFDKRMAELNTGAAGNPPLAWTDVTSADKLDRNDEEGWTLLPDGSILSVCAIAAPAAQRYVNHQWISAGNTLDRLEDPGSQEEGPQVLMNDGRVLCIGATGFNNVFTLDPNGGTWSRADSFPLNEFGQQLDVADGPACLLPSGKVLAVASPGIFGNGSHFYESDGLHFVPAVDTPDAPGQPSYVYSMLMLPTGQVMMTAQSGDVEIYTPTGSPQNAWKPRLNTNPLFVAGGVTYQLTGWQFNGLSECCFYGDDNSNATNYPLVRLTNMQNGRVTYCRTSGHSTMGVATGNTLVSTNFTVPLNVALGPSKLEVVVNGIASNPAFVDVGIKRKSISP